MVRSGDTPQAPPGTKCLSWEPSLLFHLSPFLFLAVLSEGVHLPHISTFTYTDVSVMIHKVRNHNMQVSPRNKTFKLLPATFDLKGTWE